MPKEAANNKKEASDKPRKENNGDSKSESRSSVYLKYVVYLALVGTGGWLISYTGGKILQMSGLSQVVMGATLMAIATSLPELVTAAIGDIVGGNAFIVYLKGSIFTAVTINVTFLAVLAILMTGILLISFIRREKKGIKNIGLESALIILVYISWYRYGYFCP